MKKTVRSSFNILLLCLATIAVFNSCKKDELNSKSLLIYLAGDYASAENRVMAPFVHSPADITGNTKIKIAASATREVVADVEVMIYPDPAPAVISAFNQKTNSQHVVLPDANFRVTNGYKHTILAGNTTSDSIEIEILNPQGLTNTKGYLLPVTITSIDGKDKGATISTNQRTVYLTVTYEYNNIAPTQTPLAIAPMSRTGWSVTVSNTTSGALGPAMLDGNNSTSWRSSNSSTAAKWAILNMGSTQTIKGFQLVPNYVSASENATKISVSTSTDGTTYTVQGIWKGTGPAVSSSASTPDIKGINFVAPVQARYFRFDITSWVSGSRVGIAELNAVQ